MDFNSPAISVRERHSAQYFVAIAGNARPAALVCDWWRACFVSWAYAFAHLWEDHSGFTGGYCCGLFLGVGRLRRIAADADTSRSAANIAACRAGCFRCDCARCDLGGVIV